jgi:2'-5' RNA ligase/uncharacterized protein (UPF0248 family)
MSKKILVKLPPMRTSEDVVNRIQHDESVDKDLVIVGYLDRFLGVIEKKFTSFVWCRVEMAGYLDLAIPKHRIEYFKYHGEVVWSKKDRIDKVFGSSKSQNETILEVIERHASAVEEEKLLAEANQSGLIEEEGVKKGRSTGPLRPTHFICIPFTASSIKKSVRSIQQEVCHNSSRQGMNTSDLEKEGCIPPSALHITLVMVYCPTPHSVFVAKKVFDGCLDLLNTFVPRHLLLTLQGVDSFDERVIYSPPVEIGRLTKLVTEMKNRFKAAGVRLVGNHEPYSPHMTLVKLNRKLSKTLNFDGSPGKLPRSLCGSREKDLMGQQACESIQFCELYAPKDVHTGFYRSVASLTNSPQSRPSNTVFNSNQLLKRMLSQNQATDVDPTHQISSEEILSQSEGRCLVVLMRGLPGHGKSHFSKELLTLWSETFRETLTSESLETHCVYISADDYMVGSNGESKFDPALLPTCHLRCQEKFREVLISHQSQVESEVLAPTLIVVDNTNTTPEEYAPYLSLAAQYDAETMVAEVDISHDGELNFTPYLSCDKALDYSRVHGVHDVPLHSLLRMWSR